MSHLSAEPDEPLPTQTADDLTDPSDRLRDAEDDDERLRREVPPHHGD